MKKIVATLLLTSAVGISGANAETVDLAKLKESGSRVTHQLTVSQDAEVFATITGQRHLNKSQTSSGQGLFSIGVKNATTNKIQLGNYYVEVYTRQNRTDFDFNKNQYIVCDGCDESVEQNKLYLEPNTPANFKLADTKGPLLGDLWIGIKDLESSASYSDISYSAKQWKNLTPGTYSLSAVAYVTLP